MTKSIRVKRAKSTLARVRGLIGQTDIEPLMIETRFGIHTFGMKRKMDVVILNKNYNIALTKSNMKPSRVFLWNPIFKFVLELPNDYIKDQKLKVEDKLNLKIID